MLILITGDKTEIIETKLYRKAQAVWNQAGSNIHNKSTI